MNPREDGWSPVLGFTGYYANREGQILSLKRKYPRVMRQIQSCTGHLYVFMYRDTKMQKVWVHRAVLLAFIGIPKTGFETRHLDGNPQNNDLSNLAWGTRQENSDDRVRHGTLPVGENSGSHKLTEHDVHAIRRQRGTHSLRALALQYGVSHTAIRRAALGITWSYLKGGLS